MPRASSSTGESYYSDSRSSTSGRSERPPRGVPSLSSSRSASSYYDSRSSRSERSEQLPRQRANASSPSSRYSGRDSRASDGRSSHDDEFGMERREADDGEAYTWNQFVQYYGEERALAMWETAGLVSSRTRSRDHSTSSGSYDNRSASTGSDDSWQSETRREPRSKDGRMHRVRAIDIPSDGDSEDSKLWFELSQGAPGDVRGSHGNRNKTSHKRSHQSRSRKERSKSARGYREKSRRGGDRDDDDDESGDESNEHRTVQFEKDANVVYIGQGNKSRDGIRDNSQRSVSYGWRGGKIDDTSKRKRKKNTQLSTSSKTGKKDQGPEVAPGETYTIKYSEGVERRGWAPEAWPPQSMVVGSVTSQWASAQGIEVGDELLTIDGYPVKRMSKPFLVEGMNRRPVNLVFVRRFEHDEHEYGEYQRSNHVSKDKRKKQVGIHLGFRGDSHVWKPPWGCTVLHEAAATGNAHLARLSINRSPAMASFRDSNGRTPLHYAAQEGHAALLPIVAGLPEDAYNVELSSDDLSCDAVDFLGCSPLWLASRNGHVTCCRWLLDHRADPMRRARDGSCAVWQAARFPAGAKDPPLTLAVLLASVMPLPFSGSGLHELPRFNEKLLLRDLVDKSGYTIFHAAAYDNNMPVIHWIAKHVEGNLLGLLVITRARSESGETPLHLAVLNGHLDTADLLRDMGDSTMGGRRAHGSELHGSETDQEDERRKVHREARFNLHPF